MNPIVSRARRAKGSQNNAPTTFAEATVNTVLWIVQVLWGVFFTGFGKVLCQQVAQWATHRLNGRLTSGAFGDDQGDVVGLFMMAESSSLVCNCYQQLRQG